MAKKTSFIGEFFKERRVVGAISPSSKFLMKRMVAPVDFDKAKVIVELGPGNGVFTKGILDRMAPDAKLLSFELNRSFYEHIKATIKDDRLLLINDTAEKIGDYLNEHGYNKADYIISSLPFTVIPKEIKTPIIDNCVSYLKDDGMFVQFQYSLNAMRMLNDKFKNVKLDFTPLNFPPAFVYKCTK